MKIKLLKKTHIRSSPFDMDQEPLGVAAEGSIIEVEDEAIEGAKIDLLNKWYKDKEGRYYWGGAAEEIKGTQEGKSTGQTAKIVKEEGKKQEEEEPAVKPEVGKTGEEKPAVRTAAAPPALKEEKGEADRQKKPEPQRAVLEGVTSERAPAGESGIHYDSSRMNWGIDDLEILHFFWNSHRILGQGVSVAILDTGIDENHPDFSGAIRGKFNFAEPRANDVTDRDGRGTMCAGIVAGRGHKMAWGVAPRCDLYIGKILSQASEFSYTALLSGIEWAMDKNVDILLLGLDLKKMDLTYDDQETIEQYINKAAERGILAIAPAGDSFSSHPEGRYPACLENCLSVGAYGKEGKRYASSIRSFTLDILAPGEELLTTDNRKGIVNFSGSYSAAAFAAGCMALLVNANNKNSLPLQGSDLLRLVKTTAIPKVEGNELRDFEYGYGLINPIGIFRQARSQ